MKHFATVGPHKSAFTKLSKNAKRRMDQKATKQKEKAKQENRKLNKLAHDQFTAWFHRLSRSKKLEAIDKEKARIFMDRTYGNTEAAAQREQKIKEWEKMIT